MAFYRSIKSASQGPHSVVRLPPPQVQRCLNILYAGVFVSLILTLPYFSPPNIFKETGSRLGLPTNLLQSRISGLRQGNLTPLDELFFEKMSQEPQKANAPKDLALLYAAYGPNVVLQCPFCSPAQPQSYLYYALPALMAPHLFHIFVLGVITSSFFSGSEGARWRTYATIAGVALAAGELYMTYTYNWEANGQKRMLQDVDFFYWNTRMWRQLAFAAVDGLMGWLLWLTSTNRWLVKPPTISEQLADVTNTLAGSYGQINLLGNVRNAIVRDNELRTTHGEYWLSESREMQDIEREREVVDAKNIALSRMDFEKTQRRAEIYVDQIFASLQTSESKKDS
jgi:hypothetical protein